MIFTILLYLVIGPFFALPRLATTSYEIGIAPHVSSDMQTWLLALFSALFLVLLGGFHVNQAKFLIMSGSF